MPGTLIDFNDFATGQCGFDLAHFRINVPIYLYMIFLKFDGVIDFAEATFRKNKGNYNTKGTLIRLQ